MTASTGPDTGESLNEQAPPKTVLLASPRGYCAGVDRAVITVEKALDLYGTPVYVRKEIVHNAHVVQTLRDRGAIFVEESFEALKNFPGEQLVVFYRSSESGSASVLATMERAAQASRAHCAGSPSPVFTDCVHVPTACGALATCSRARLRSAQRTHLSAAC